MSGWFLLFVMLVGLVVALYLGATLTLSCRIGAEAVEVLLFGMVVRRVRFDDIEEVHRRGALIHEGWVGLRFWDAVTLRRRSGWVRNFVISPAEPDRFVDALRARLFLS